MTSGYRKNGLVDLRKLPTVLHKPLGRQNAHGLAQSVLFSDFKEIPPDYPTIVLDPGLSRRKRLEIIIHESLHHACPFLLEIVVTKAARYIAMVLWRLDYRDPDSQPE